MAERVTIAAALSREIGTGVVGVGVGFVLYLLISGLGRGRSDGTGASAGEGPSPLTPPRPIDDQPVQVVVQPSPADPTKAVIKLEGRIVSVGDLVSRIDAGGRRDVSVTVTGDTTERAWIEIREALTFLGIHVFQRAPSRLPPHVGNARGQYGQRDRRST